MTTAVQAKHKKINGYYQVNESDYKQYISLEEKVENDWMANVMIDSLKSGLVGEKRSKALLDDMKKSCE